MDPATFALIESIGNHAIERRFGKIAGARLNTGMFLTGLQAPGQIERAYQRAGQLNEDLVDANRMTIGDALELNKRASLFDNKEVREGLGKGFGGAIGTAGGAALAGIAGKAYSAIMGYGEKQKRLELFKQVTRQDAVLSQADPKVLQSAYDTMVRFAPTLSTDPHAVTSFLRQAVTSGSGPDYATIRMLADAERAVTHKEGMR